jgi:hypothetical protein
VKIYLVTQAVMENRNVDIKARERGNADTAL